MANSLPTYESKELKNGMQVVAIPINKGSGVISTNIFYRVGSRNEVMGKSGIAHMLEHMNFKSTKNLKAGEFDTKVKSIGGVNNASTGFDFTNYFIKSSSEHLKDSLSLFAELMQNLRLKEDEFLSERDVVAEERRWRTDNNPLGYLYFRLFNNAYIYHSYHWTPIGFMNDILTWELEDIEKFHSLYYQPQNATLVVAGDIDPSDLFKVASEEFGSITNSSDIPQVKLKEPLQDGAKRIIIERDSEVEIVAIAYHIPDFKDKDQVALSAISQLLSSGKSSRLYSSLVNKKRLVNQIYAYNMENIDPGLFIFLASCNPDINATTVEKELLEQIDLLVASTVSQEEIEKIKINTKADFIYSLQDSSSVANLFGSYIVRGDIEPLMSYEQSIKELTPKLLQEVAQRYFQAKNSTTIILKKGSQ